MNSSLEDRARDIMAAFSDKSNKAVFASIGGMDQIKLIKLMDPRVFLDNPKPFFGFSDNTHLHNFLWSLGITSYYGGGIMNQFGMNIEMFDMTVSSLTHALFETGEFELEVSDEFNDEGLDWSNKENLYEKRHLEPNSGLLWDGTIDTEGILWGGCVESLIMQATTEKYLPSKSDIKNCVLILETSEALPESWIVDYLLTGFGERGWLDVLSGVLVGRPKAWEFDKPYSKAQKAKYKQDQAETILRAIREYNKDIPVIQNLDFGHTDPQLIMPLGRKARIISSEKKIYLNY
jgi:muramoyltetrapeptide carboxypeptidase LdcA involved in peptidoglycan recycling